MKRTVEAKPMEASEFQVFSEVDLNQYGRIGSYMPAWAYTQLIDDLKNEINNMELQVRVSNISAERLSELEKSITNKKERLYEIEEGKPKIDKDKIDELQNTLGEKIADSMFSRTDMMRGIADAHEEARRMTEKCIKLSDTEAKFAKACNIPVSKDKTISRNHASKAWKIARRYLGENSNIELLRRG